MSASILEALGLRAAIHVRATFSERELRFTVGSRTPHLAWDYAATIHIHNEGKVPITVGGAGWLAADGSVLEASLPHAASLDPGDPELIAEKPVTDVLEQHRAHGGVIGTWVWLSGEAKPRTQPVDAGWEAELADYVARLTG